MNFKSFLAMMPPLKYEIDHPEKNIIDTFYTDRIPEKPIDNLPISLRFTMEVGDYEPLYQNSYQGSLSDNDPDYNYHKMYIAFAGASEETVTKGTIWRASTRYQIDIT